MQYSLWYVVPNTLPVGDLVTVKQIPADVHVFCFVTIFTKVTSVQRLPLLGDEAASASPCTDIPTCLTKPEDVPHRTCVSAGAKRMLLPLLNYRSIY